MIDDLNKIRYDYEFEYDKQPIISYKNSDKESEQRKSILEICE